MNIGIIVSLPNIVSNAVEKLGYDDDDLLRDATAGLGNFCLTFGQMIGPLLSGFLKDLIGYKNGALCVGGVGLVLMVVYGGVLGCHKRRSRENRFIEMES